MIRSFGAADTERIWHEQYLKRVDRTVLRATIRKPEPIHPGESLMEDFIEGFGNTQHKLAVSSACRRDGSMRPCTASALAPRTRRSGALLRHV